MPTLDYAPSPEGTSEDVTNKVRTAQFGDGYSQRVKDGINSTQRSWTVNFALPMLSVEAIEKFLKDRRGAESFTWKPPYGIVGNWICESWRRTPVGQTQFTISATFKEVFGE